MLSSVVAQLVAQRQDDIAWKVFDTITSPAIQAYTLVAAAQEYQYLGDSQASFALAVRAMRLAQSDDFSEDEYFVPLAAQYREFGDYDLEKVIAEGRERIIYEALYVADTPEQLQSLIERVENESLRADLVSQFLPADAPPNEAEASVATAMSLRGFASSMAREGRFQEALEAVADIESPHVQAEALINIAQCHANGSSVLDDEMRLILEGLR